MNGTVVIHFWRINVEVSKNDDFRRMDHLGVLIEGAVGCSMFGLERHFWEELELFCAQRLCAATVDAKEVKNERRRPMFGCADSLAAVWMRKQTAPIYVRLLVFWSIFNA